MTLYQECRDVHRQCAFELIQVDAVYYNNNFDISFPEINFFFIFFLEERLKQIKKVIKGKSLIHFQGKKWKLAKHINVIQLVVRKVCH